VTGKNLRRELSIHRLSPFTQTWSLTLIEPEGGAVSSPRSGEHGKLEEELPPEFSDVPILRLNQTCVDSELEVMGLRSLHLNAEWTQHIQSVENLFRFLFALRESYLKQIAQNDPDFVIFCRPDINISGRLALDFRLFQLAAISVLRLPAAILPAWGRSRGINDRFAILNRESLENYFLRLDRAFDFFRNKPNANAERFLQDSLLRVFTLNTVFTPMPRIRIQGRVQEEDKKLVELGAFGLRLSVYRARLNRLWRRLERLWVPVDRANETNVQKPRKIDQ